jgi:hypothetical protein
MLQITFATAVLRTINDFRSKKSDFSAYAVTHAVRSAANKGEIAIQGMTAEPIDGAQTFRIDHEEVREMVVEFYTNGLIADYRKDRGMSNGQTYIKYVYVDPSPTQVPPQISPQATHCVSGVATPHMVSSYTQTPQKFNLTFKLPANPPKNANVGRILGYVSSKKARGGIPTLKSIQSALKGIKITTKEIQSVLINNGFQVTPKPGVKPSLAIVS